MTDKELTPRSIGAALGAAVGHMTSVSAMLNTSFGVFMVSLTQEFHWSRTEISASHIFYSWTMALLFPFSGRLMDRFGVRAVVLPGLVLFALVFAALSAQTGSIYFFYAMFVVLGICGAAGGQVPFSKVVAGWFHRYRGVVLAVVAFGATAASGLIPQATRWLVERFGWRGAYLGLAGYILLVGVPLVWLLLRESPVVEAARRDVAAHKAAGAEVLGLTAAEARVSRPFLLCVGAVSLTMIINSGLVAHAVALLTDRGVPMNVAVTFLTFSALGGATARLLEGVLLDRVNSPRLALPFVAMALAGVLLLQYGHGSTAYMISGAMLGAGIAGETAIIPYFFTRYFGLRAFAEIYGTLWAAAAIATGVGPVIMGRVFDTTGSYNAGLTAAAVAFALAAVLFALLPPYRFAARLSAPASEPDVPPA